VDYLDRLAAFVAATRFDALPAPAVDAAKLVLLDTLGAIVAGSAERAGVVNFKATPVVNSSVINSVVHLAQHPPQGESGWAGVVLRLPGA